MDARISNFLRSEIGDLIAVYLFGSRARGEARADSDFDIAVLAQQPLDEVRRWKLAQELAMRLHRDVDLVDLRRASTVLRAHIISSARIVIDVDSASRARFEGLAYADYARLNEERRAILKRIKDTGSIYG